MFSLWTATNMGKKHSFLKKIFRTKTPKKRKNIAFKKKFTKNQIFSFDLKMYLLPTIFHNI